MYAYAATAGTDKILELVLTSPEHMDTDGELVVCIADNTNGHSSDGLNAPAEKRTKLSSLESLLVGCGL